MQQTCASEHAKFYKWVAITASSALNERRSQVHWHELPTNSTAGSVISIMQHEGNCQWCARYTHGAAHNGETTEMPRRRITSPREGWRLRSATVSHWETPVCCVLFLLISLSVSFSSLHISPQRYSALAGLVANCQLRVRKNRLRGQFVVRRVAFFHFFFFGTKVGNNATTRFQAVRKCTRFRRSTVKRATVEV